MAMNYPMSYPLYALGISAFAALAAATPRIKRRLELSRAKHRSMTGHARLSRRIASIIPYYGYDEARFFTSDGAPPEIEAKRRAGFTRLSSLFRTRYAITLRHTAEVKASVSDMQFTGLYRVPLKIAGYHPELSGK